MSVSFNSQNTIFDSMRTSKVAQRPSFTATPEPTEPKPQPVQDEVVTTEAPKKKKSLWQKTKNVYTNIKKGLITASEYTVGAVKGLFYGAIGVVGVIGVDAIRNAVKKAPAGISTKGKLIAGAVGLATLGYQLFKANLNANERKSNVDHRWATGHNAD